MTKGILFVTGEYPPMRGGIGDYTQRLIESLSGTGWSAYVLTGTAAAGNPDPRVLPHIARWDWRLAGAIRQALRETGADAVHIQYQTGAFQMHPAVNLLPRRLGRGRQRVPLMTTFHDLLPPYLFPKAGHLRETVTRMLATGSDAVVATNPDDYAVLRSFPRLATRAYQIPIGSNLPAMPEAMEGEVRQSARVRLEVADGDLAVAFFGFLTQDKGVELLIDALELLKSRHAAMRTHLVIIGGGLAQTDQANAAYHRWMQEKLARIAFPVTQTGHLSATDAAALLSAVDLIVLPFRAGASLRHGTLIAALRSGVPVLTTDPGAEKSLAPFAGGESIWLVPPGDREALAGGIEVLLANPTLRHRLAGNARSESRAFDWESIAQRHAELYARVVTARNGAKAQTEETTRRSSEGVD